MHRKEVNMRKKWKDLSKRRRLISGFMTCMILGVYINGYTASAYDRDAAVTYASEYCSTYNSKYPKYGNDCTNFASQVLNAGGYKTNPLPDADVSYSDLGTVYKTKKYWSAKKYTKSIAGIISKTDFVSTSTWSNVDQLAGSSFYGLQDYMVSEKGKVCKSYSVTKKGIKQLIKEAKPGDIVQVAKKDARFSHSYIVGKIAKDKAKNRTDVYVYAHSDNRDAGDSDCLLRMLENKKLIDYTYIALIKA